MALTYRNPPSGAACKEARPGVVDRLFPVKSISYGVSVGLSTVRCSTISGCLAAWRSASARNVAPRRFCLNEAKRLLQRALPSCGSSKPAGSSGSHVTISNASSTQGSSLPTLGRSSLLTDVEADERFGDDDLTVVPSWSVFRADCPTGTTTRSMMATSRSVSMHSLSTPEHREGTWPAPREIGRASLVGPHPSLLAGRAVLS